jgi:hypothetical protein
MEEGCEEVGRRPGCACGAVVALISILLFALSWDTLEPTEFGLIQNGFTGSVEMRAERTFEGGRYFVWLNHHFLVFPRNLVNLEYSGRSHCPPSSYYSGMQDYDCANQGPISARTGRDDHDAESGGQPIELSVAFQYKFARRDVTRVYEKFAMMWEPSFLRFAQQAITNVAQRFTPSQFWLARHEVELAMLHEVNQTIYQEGHATVEGLQLLVVEFQPVYETTITNIQLQEQLKVTKNYQKDVTRVLKEVDVLQSQTNAEIVEIDAQAARESAVVVNEAEAAALQLEQGTKAVWYAALKEALHWSNADLLRYVKLKSIIAQPSDRMVVGVSAVEGQAPVAL